MHITFRTETVYDQVQDEEGRSSSVPREVLTGFTSVAGPGPDNYGDSTDGSASGLTTSELSTLGELLEKWETNAKARIRALRDLRDEI